MPAPAKNLDDVKTNLLIAFNKAIKRVDETGSDDVIEKMSRVAAEIAEKIALIEREQAFTALLKAAQQGERDIEVDLDKRAIRSAVSSPAAKVKSL